MEFKTEKEFTEYLLPLLKQHNYIQEQVKCENDGKTIDIIMKPKDFQTFKDKEIIFGIELKNPAKIDTKASHNAMIQTIEYSRRKFIGIDKIYCFSINKYEENDQRYLRAYQIMNNIFSMHGIGSWQFIDGTFTLYYKSEKIYDTRYGWNNRAKTINNYLEENNIIANIYRNF